MRVYTRSVAALLAAASGVIAQTTTSPAGLEQTEGVTRFFMFGADRRLQVIDQSQLGRPATWSTIAFRRDGTSSSSGWGPRRMDCTVRLGQGRLDILSGNPDRNYQGNPTVVFTRKPVDMPDWRPPTANPPAAFDFVIQLDAPFSYPATQALIWDVTSENSTNTAHAAMDREFTAFRFALGTELGTGCVATGQSRPFSHLAYLGNGGAALGPFGMHLRFSGTSAPPNTSVLVHLDVADANLRFPGLCHKVHAMPLIAVAIGRADRGGSVTEHAWSFPFIPAVQGSVLVTQMFALDFGQSGLPIAVSSGRRTAMPSAGSTGSRPAAYVFARPGEANSVVVGGAPIALFR